MGQSVNLIEYIEELIGDDYVSYSELLEVQEAIEYINENGQIDTNETTLNGALLTLGELMETNLKSMGVSDADASNGLMTLAEQVLDVEPSVSGMDGLSLSLSLSSDKNKVSVGESLTLTSILSVSYDDTSITNVDLTGVITGATITFKDIANDTLLGTGVTDITGTATLTFNTNFNEDTDIRAFFNGTDNFDSCNSPICSVATMRSIVLTSSVNELSDEVQNITFTATLTGGSSNCSVKWYNDDTLLDTTSFTNNTTTYTISTTGNEDNLDISAVLYWNNNILQTETISFSKAVTINSASMFSGMNQYGDYMGVYSDAYRYLNTPVALPSSWEISWTMINTRSNSAWCMALIGEDTSHNYRIGKPSRTTAGAYLSNSTPSESDSIRSNVEYPMKITYKDGVYNLIYNNHNMTFSDPTYQPLYLLGFGLAGYQGNGARIKNIQIKKF